MTPFFAVLQGASVEKVQVWADSAPPPALNRVKVLKKQMFINPDDPHELAMITKNEKKPDFYARKTCNLLNTISEVFFFPYYVLFLIHHLSSVI